LGDLVQAYEFEREKKISQAMKIVIGNFPKQLIDIAKYFNENINSDSEKMEYLMTSPQQWTKISEVTVKQLQVILKKALNKIEVLDVVGKLKIDHFEMENIIKYSQTTV
jgi:hypothetical protein